jgi:hypothetical protein
MSRAPLRISTEWWCIIHRKRVLKTIKYNSIVLLDCCLTPYEQYFRKYICQNFSENYLTIRGHRSRDRMVVGFTTTYVISTYHHWNCEFEPLCDKVCQLLATGQWFSPGTLASSTNKIDCHDITEILLKVALNTINLNLVDNHHIFSLYIF